MNLLERLEVIAADYYTKAMAIRTTIEILRKVDNTEVAFSPSKKRKKYNMSAAKRKAVGQRIRAYWAKRRRGNKDNKRSGTESGKE